MYYFVWRILIIIILTLNSHLFFAQITADISSGCAPLDVKFSPPAGMTTYYWDFGDGSSSETANPTNKFITPKNPFKVTLRACKTCPVLYSYDIAVFPKPSITTPDIKGCAPLNAIITPSITLPPGIQVTSIKYLFGDGSSQIMTSPTLSPAVHLYTNGNATYPLTFEVVTSPSNAGCDHSVTIPNAIKTSNLSVSILANPSAGCKVPFTTTFSSTISNSRPIASYNWDFGNGASSSIANPSYTYTQIGTYSVSLKVKDDYGCEKIAYTTVIVKDNDMTKIISVDTICVNDMVSLDHDGNWGLNSYWSTPGSIFGSSNTTRPSFVGYTTVGLKTISLTTSYSPGNLCPKTVTKQLNVIDPKLNVNITPRPLCNKKNTFTLNLINSNLFTGVLWKLYYYNEMGTKVYLDTISKQFSETVTYTIKDLDSIAWQYKKINLEVEGTSKFGCKVIQEDTNFISPIIAHIVPTTTFGCAPLKVGFYDKTTRYRKDTLVEWYLDFGDGTNATYTAPLTSDTFYHTYSTRGEYKMKAIVKNKYGCLDTTYITTIKVGTPHSLDFLISPPTSLCASDPSSIIYLQSLVSPDSVQSTKFWADGFHCFHQENVFYNPSKKAGTFPIKMEVLDNGCASSISKYIVVKGPIAKFVYTQNCNALKDAVFTNTSQDATSYLWDFGDGASSTNTNPSHTYATDGDYIVQLIAYNATNGCPPDTYRIPLKIQSPKAILGNDSFVFCTTDVVKTIKAPNSSGYFNDGNNTGFIWEFYSDRSPLRTFIDSFNYVQNDTITDTVYLTVRNFMNCVSRDTAFIKVDRVDLTPAVSPTLICSGDLVNFTGNYSMKYPAVSTIWDFGDLNTSTTANSSHIYNFNSGSGPFYVNYNVTNSIGCNAVYNQTINIKTLGLNSTISNNICITTNPINLIAFTKPVYPTNISWKLPNGTIVNGSNISYNFPSQGNYVFSIYAIDINNSNCKDTIIRTIAAWNKPKLAILSNKDSITTLCDPLNIDLKFKDLNNTNIIGVLKWQVSNSAGVQNYTSTTVSTPLLRGINTVTFIASNSYCSDTVIRNFKVNAPSGELEISKNDICKGDEITFTVKNLIDVTDYSIDFGDGTVVNNVSPIIHRYTYVPIGGQTKAKAIFATNGNDCVGKPIDTTIRIHEVYAKFGLDFNADTPICFRPVHIKDSSLGADKYSWDFGDGTFSNTKEPGFKKYTTAGIYIINQYIENTQFGCKDTFKDTLSLIPKPISKPKNDTTCLGNTTQVIQPLVQKNVAYYWLPKSSFQKNPEDTSYVKFDTTSTYYAVALDTVNRCSDTVKAFVRIVQPMPSIKIDTILSPGEDFILPFDLKAGYSNIWTPDSFLSCTNCSNPTAQYIINPIKYIVRFKDMLKNCFYDSSIYNIRIYPDILVNAPTAFTPNGDGNNDVYYARGFGIKKLTAFKIYNRLGQLLFYSVSENDGWDGNYKGVPQNSDTYFYTIEGESFIKGKIVHKEGNFLLLR